MNINQMKYFITVVEEGTISKAAQKLFMAQPPLSKQIKLLEEELGCQLIIRRHSNILLTSEGELLYSRSKEMLKLQEQTLRDIKYNIYTTQKLIRIGFISSYAEIFVNKIYPNLPFKDNTLSFVDGTTSLILEKLHNKLLNFAFVRTPFNENNINTITVKQEKIYLVTDDPNFSDVDSIEVEQLDNKELIVFVDFIPTLKGIMDKKMLNFVPKVGTIADICLKIVMKTGGYAIVPDTILNENNTTLYRCELKIKNYVSQIKLVYYNENKNSRFIKQIIKMIEDKEL